MVLGMAGSAIRNKIEQSLFVKELFCKVFPENTDSQNLGNQLVANNWVTSLAMLFLCGWPELLVAPLSNISGNTRELCAAIPNKVEPQCAQSLRYQPL